MSDMPNETELEEALLRVAREAGPPIKVVRFDLIGVQGRVIRALLSAHVVDGRLDPDVWENLCAALPDVDPSTLREVIRHSTFTGSL